MSLSTSALLAIDASAGAHCFLFLQRSEFITLRGHPLTNFEHRWQRSSWRAIVASSEQICSFPLQKCLICQNRALFLQITGFQHHVEPILCHNALALAVYALAKAEKILTLDGIWLATKLQWISLRSHIIKDIIVSRWIGDKLWELDFIVESAGCIVFGFFSDCLDHGFLMDVLLDLDVGVVPLLFDQTFDI